MIVKLLKIFVGLIVVVMLAVVGVAGTGLYLGEQKANRRIEVPVRSVAYVTDPASHERGRYLFDSRGCGGCHGAKGEGTVVVDEGGMYARSPNIGTGKGSVVREYKEADWDRSIRHGVKPAGNPMMLMPSMDYNRLSDADFAALVSYVRSLPPTEGGAGEVRFPLIARILYGFGKIPDPAELIDHSLAPSASVAIGVSVENGKYVAAVCAGCHGEHFSGGPIPGTPPNWPPAANLTPGEGSALARYPSAELFKAMIRSGKRPDGTAVSDVMPFPTLRNISDVDLDALYLFLKSLPPLAAGGR